MPNSAISRLNRLNNRNGCRPDCKNLLADLVDLAKSDDADAKAIVDKYGISINAPGGAAPASSPAGPGQ